MTPLEALERRERRIDALIDRVESGVLMTADDWRQFDLLNTLDLMSVSQGAARETVAMEQDADGLLGELPNGSLSSGRADPDRAG